jgi:glycosyltransferase involved in cell wall biosynthesis
MKKIRAFPNNSASSYWRFHDPYKYLQGMGIDAKVTTEGINEKLVQENDIFVLKGTVDKEGIALLRAYQKKRGKKIVVDMDDLPDLNPDNPYMAEHTGNNNSEVIKITLGIADMVTTTTKKLKNQLLEYNNNVVVLPNYLNMDRWDLKQLPNTSDKIRIGWIGSLTHMKDLELVVEPLKRIMKEYKNVQVVFMGDLRIKEMFEGYNVEVMLGVPFEFYPLRLHGLRLDIGLAPLQKNIFNECKSNIKFMEYAITKTAGVYSPTVYQHKGFEPKFGLVAYDENGWYHSIRNLIEYPELRREIAEGAYRHVTARMDLKTHAPKWLEAYQSI